MPAEVMVAREPDRQSERTLSRRYTLTRSLEDLEVSLLKAGARKTGISTFTHASPSSRAPKVKKQAARHVTVSRSGCGGLDLSLISISCRHQRSSTKVSATANGGIRLPRKHVASPECSTRARIAARKPVVREPWVWNVGNVLEAKKQQSSQPSCGETGQTTATEADESSGVQGKSSCVSAADMHPSSFNSSCSTEAPTEHTLSVRCASTPSPKRPSSKHQLERSALDAAFLHHLSDMSLRFPDAPTRPPPDPSETNKATSTSVLATSKWSKGIAASLPSLQILLPSAWHRGSHRNNRRRKSTALWVSRSKTTNSSISESSFSRRKAALPSRTAAFPDTPTSPAEEPGSLKAADAAPVVGRVLTVAEGADAASACVLRQLVVHEDHQGCSPEDGAQSHRQHSPVDYDDDRFHVKNTHVAKPPCSSVVSEVLPRLPPLPPLGVAPSPPLGISRSKGSEKRSGREWDTATATAEGVGADCGPEALSSWVWGETAHVPRPGERVSKAGMMDRRQQQRRASSGRGRVSRVGGFTENSGYEEVSWETIGARRVFLAQ